MKNLTAFFLVSSLFFVVPVMAGSGHDHGHSHAETPVDQETAKINASKAISSLVTRNKVGKSWASIAVSSIEQKKMNGVTEWVAIFINEKITDANKRKLYVFMTLGGSIVAVNYSGN